MRNLRLRTVLPVDINVSFVASVNYKMPNVIVYRYFFNLTPFRIGTISILKSATTILNIQFTGFFLSNTFMNWFCLQIFIYLTPLRIGMNVNFIECDYHT